jgi:type VI secretion system secreted protein VgrG
MREGRYAWILAPALCLALAGCADSDKPLGIAEGGAGTSPATVNLATAGNFGVLGQTAVNNSGATTVDAEVGVGTGGTLTGFPPGTATQTHNNDATTTQAQLDLGSAFTDAASRNPTAGITTDLANLKLGPGVFSAASVTNSGVVTLNALGDTTAVFIIISNTTLTADSGSQVVLTNGARADNVYWIVGTSATLGSDSVWYGNILADQSITLDSGATLYGRALSKSGAVTLDTNVVDVP